MKDGQRRPQNGNMDLMVEPKHKGQLADRERDGKTSYMVSLNLKNNDKWIKVAQNQREWKQMESEFASAALQRDGRRRRSRAGQQKGATKRYLNGELLEEGQIMNIYWSVTVKNYVKTGQRFLWTDEQREPATS